MLPGFRFLFAAIVLSMSILVFGLGAAALLRAAHEQFASNPSWRAAPEATFAQQAEATRPVLALLRVEPAAPGQKQSDNVPAVAAPVKQDTNLSTPAEQAPAASAPAQSGQVAALKPEETPPPEVARSASPAPESPAPSEAAAQAQSDAPASADVAETAAPAPDKLASTEPVSPPALDLPPPANVAPVASEPAASVQASTPASLGPDAASTKIATLGGPKVVVETPTPAKATGERHEDRDAIKKRQQARRAAQRRRLAARARLAARQAPQQTNPFAQPPTPAR
jgi:hypothetical protein